MIIAFLVVSAAIALICKVTAKKYTELLQIADDRSYRLKAFLPVGLFIMEATRYRFASGYDKRLLSALAELWEPRQAHKRLKLHWSCKIVHLLLALLFILFIGAFTRPDTGFIVFAAAVTAGALYITDKELYQRVKARKLSIRMDFPDFAGKLMLLVNAGMTVTRAWERIAGDSSKDRKSVV